jgi:hypothetical protein
MKNVRYPWLPEAPMSNGAASQAGFKGTAKPKDFAHMAAFDSLPSELRAAVRDAVFDWDTGAISLNLRMGVKPSSIVQHIAKFEREAHERFEKKRVQAAACTRPVERTNPFQIRLL